MSNLLKSKILLGVIAFAFVFTLGVSKASAYSTLKYGMRSAEVSTLQGLLSVSPATGYFGNITKAAVMAFQADNSLTADGVVGPATWAALTSGSNSGSGSGSGSTACPAGFTCTSNAPVVSCPVGFTCTSNSSSTTTTLSGGAGTLTFTSTTANTEDVVKEGAEEKVLAFKAEADGSDIAVTNLKVLLSNSDWANSSEKLSDYVEEVSVYMGSTKVGSADASDFSRDLGSPDVYSKTISLSNAVVDDGEKATFYVALSAESNIDSDDLNSPASWGVEADSVRYTDATGITLSDTVGDSNAVTFEDASVDDDISIKTSQSNPIAATLTVDSDQDSDEYLVGAFKLDVDEDSSDVMVSSLAVTLTVANNSVVTSTADSVFESVSVNIDGTDYDLDLTADDFTQNGTAVYDVEFDEDEVSIDAGDDSTVKVNVVFNDQDGNYSTGTTVVASVVGSTAIDAETSDDDVTVTGSFTGKTHTLSVDAPTFSLVSKSLTPYQAIDGVAAGEEDVFLAKFVFNVTASEDEDVYLSKGVEGDADYAAANDTTMYTQLGGGDVDSAILDADDETLDDGLTSSFLISAGTTEKFTLSFYVRGNDEAEKFTIDSFAYGDADDASTTYAYSSVVNSGLSSFATSTTYLAK